jgi:hypothetical protein
MKAGIRLIDLEDGSFIKNHKELRVMTTLFPNPSPIRNGKNFLLFALLTLFFGLTITSQASAQKIIVFDAPNSGTGAFQGTQATGINLEGTITGNVTDNGFGTHGFVRTPNGSFTNFDAPGADPCVFRSWKAAIPTDAGPGFRMMPGRL